MFYEHNKIVTACGFIQCRYMGMIFFYLCARLQHYCKYVCHRGAGYDLKSLIVNPDLRYFIQITTAYLTAYVHYRQSSSCSLANSVCQFYQSGKRFGKGMLYCHSSARRDNSILSEYALLQTKQIPSLSTSLFGSLGYSPPAGCDKFNSVDTGS